MNKLIAILAAMAGACSIAPILFVSNHLPSHTELLLLRSGTARNDGAVSQTTKPHHRSLRMAAINLHAVNREEQEYYNPRTDRFPTYGSPAFSRACSWLDSNCTRSSRAADRKCTYLAEPSAKSGEGIGSWVSLVVSSFLLAVQSGCRLRVEYPGVDLGQIMDPIDEVFNWTESKPGYRVVHGRRLGKKRELVDVPSYRHLYWNHKVNETALRDLQEELPGFQLGTGMACAFGRIVRLSDGASRYEPDLFTRILPTLQDEGSLVITLYIRTGRTDVIAKDEVNGLTVDAANDTTTNTRCVPECALERERELLRLGGPAQQRNIRRVVWMVLSDSPNVKNQIALTYDGQNANAAVPADQRRWPSATLPRVVLMTSARGVHTRPKRGPTTADWAEGFIDWYLLGESDVVVSPDSFYSYGTTGAMRTDRPIYFAGTANRCSKCERGEMIVSDETKKGDYPVLDPESFIVS